MEATNWQKTGKAKRDWGEQKWNIGEGCLEPAALPCGDVTTSRASRGLASCQTGRDTQLSHLVSMGDEMTSNVQMGGSTGRTVTWSWAMLHKWLPKRKKRSANVPAEHTGGQSEELLVKVPQLFLYVFYQFRETFWNISKFNVLKCN